MDTTARKLDRRVIRTRQLLRDALMELIVEKGYEGISIQEIADRADVARPTFYQHFRDKDDLLFQTMSEIYATLQTDAGELPEEYLFDPDGAIHDSTDFEHVAALADFYKVMLGKKGSPAFLVNVRQFLAEVSVGAAIHTMQAQGRTPRLPADLIANFMAGAELGVIAWWLENGQPYSPQEMARMVFQLSMLGGIWALGFDTETLTKLVEQLGKTDTEEPKKQ
ncbi:MAG: TetR/AcrR family transcriptional regulator [Anaerolineaceae bacterium]|nr:TetR/AcrR family transcriptional regulator [Anaerolineaceae bacterium]